MIKQTVAISRVVSKLTFACYLFLFRHGLHGKHRFSLFFFREIREIRA